MSKLRILFLCTGNSCRSQMAEGWARHFGRVEACSAGIEAQGLNPRAVEVMAEAGVDIRAQQSKTLADLAGLAGLADLAGSAGSAGSAGLDELPLDVVVTVCGHADETCPTLPGGVRKVHRGFDDPPQLAAGEQDPERALAPYRRVRDEIRRFVEGLPESLEGL